MNTSLYILTFYHTASYPIPVAGAEEVPSSSGAASGGAQQGTSSSHHEASKLPVCEY
jgi:hypothetical protein